MNDLEQKIVELLDEGWSRWKIAEKIGLGESTVREVIRRLCAQYECSQRDLPERVAKENGWPTKN